MQIILGVIISSIQIRLLELPINYLTFYLDVNVPIDRTHLATILQYYYLA